MAYGVDSAAARALRRAGRRQPLYSNDELQSQTSDMIRSVYMDSGGDECSRWRPRLHVEGTIEQGDIGLSGWITYCNDSGG